MQNKTIEKIPSQEIPGWDELADSNIGIWDIAWEVAGGERLAGGVTPGAEEGTTINKLKVLSNNKSLKIVAISEEEIHSSCIIYNKRR